jgi:ABC-type Fe3+ transport system permease subunit
MITITLQGIYVISSLLSLAIALVVGIHLHQLDNCLRELKVHNDPRVKYFTAAVSFFGTAMWVILGAIFACLMVYEDFRRLGL